MDYNFYSSREERLSKASSATKRAYQKRKKIGFFKRNPQLKILVIDLFLVLLFAVIIIPFFLRITKDIRIDDYKIESKALVFEDKMLISVKVTKLYKKINKRVTTDQIKVVIMNNEILTSKEELFPVDAGEDKYITFKLDDDLNIEIINISISSGDYIKEYNVKVDR